MSNADIAMYRAKEEGRNNAQLFTSSMNASIALRVSLENDLRKALSRRELVLHYQPIAGAEDGRVVGAEALLRWKHPERGLLLPADFITIAEETGLIVPIGEWVLRTACAQARAWDKDGLPELRMSVNLSARQFLQPGLVQTVRSCLRQTHVEANRLQLEITEASRCKTRS